ncbi:MAG: hypothetical protein ACLGGV_07110 [Bacteroidia bacterium]
MHFLNQNWVKHRFWAVFILTFLSSCEDKNPLDIDVPNENVSLQFERIDQQLFNTPIQKDSVLKMHFQLLNQYPELYKSFVEVMLQQGNAADTSTAYQLVEFLSNKDMRKIFSAINEIYPQQAFLKEEFTNAFTYYKHYFPEANIPKIVGFYSNYNAKTLLADSSIAVGLELYLGTNHAITQQVVSPNLPQYLKDKMQPDYLVSDALKYFLLTQYYQTIGDDFLSTIVSMGKIMYLLDALQPKVEDWKKMGYTKTQLEWCAENEEQIWKYIVEEQLLFSINQERINHFTDEGPFTKGLPQESPAMVGIWMGWQIVRDYMNENSKVSLQELIDETDSKKILKYYQPD